jgi:hypothetical protein
MQATYSQNLFALHIQHEISAYFLCHQVKQILNWNLILGCHHLYVRNSYFLLLQLTFLLFFPFSPDRICLPSVMESITLDCLKLHALQAAKLLLTCHILKLIDFLPSNAHHHTPAKHVLESIYLL